RVEGGEGNVHLPTIEGTYQSNAQVCRERNARWIDWWVSVEPGVERVEASIRATTDHGEDALLGHGPEPRHLLFGEHARVRDYFPDHEWPACTLCRLVFAECVGEANQGTLRVA